VQGWWKRPWPTTASDADAVADREDLAGSSERIILEVASSEGRAVITNNIKDFRPLAAKWLAQGRTHAGLIREPSFLDSRRRRPRIRAAAQSLEQISDPGGAAVAWRVPVTSSREPIYVAVIGPDGKVAEEEADKAVEVGRLLAERGAILVCGGLGGVMAAACEGAASRGGLTVGLLPGSSRADGNPYLSVVLPTGMRELRNGLVVSASDAVIAVGGSWGTLSEIALAMRTDKPTIVIGGWKVEDLRHGLCGDLVRAASAEEAVNWALTMAADNRKRGAT
jgi:uncharacterized protein (TIGR00725 family)